jgi:hypothetical protein
MIHALINTDNVVIGFVNWDGTDPDQFGDRTPIVASQSQVAEGDIYQPASRTFHRGVPLAVRQQQRFDEQARNAILSNLRYLDPETRTGYDVEQIVALTEQHNLILRHLLGIPDPTLS